MPSGGLRNNHEKCKPSVFYNSREENHFSNWKLGSCALSGKMLIVRSVENDAYFSLGQVRLSLTFRLWYSLEEIGKNTS